MVKRNSRMTAKMYVKTTPITTQSKKNIGMLDYDTGVDLFHDYNSYQNVADVTELLLKVIPCKDVVLMVMTYIDNDPDYYITDEKQYEGNNAGFMHSYITVLLKRGKDLYEVFDRLCLYMILKYIQEKLSSDSMRYFEPGRLRVFLGFMHENMMKRESITSETSKFIDMYEYKISLHLHGDPIEFFPIGMRAQIKPADDILNYIEYIHDKGTQIMMPGIAKRYPKLVVGDVRTDIAKIFTRDLFKKKIAVHPTGLKPFLKKMITFL